MGAAGSGGLTLLGYEDRAYAPIAWTSPDGATFTEHELGGATFAGGVSSLLAASSSGLASLGWTADSTDRVVRSIWQASDGTSWSASPGDLFGALRPLPSGSCPASPTTAAALMSLDGAQLPACYGNRAISVSGYVTGCGGCGGTVPYVSSPSWLIDALGFFKFWLGPQVVQAEAGPQGIGVQVDPAHPISIPKVGSHVRLTGHFDDAASATCRTLPEAGSGAELLPPSIAILRCRETFVATGVSFLK